ncbi:MAG: DUF1640 domain-containing protein [Magnetococcales bacterium]|nr:DUF1640 domain-containing protein [Magnetococcales bacterium]
MSSTVAFDTLKYARRLKEIGIPAPQAEMHAELLAEALAERLASKENLTRTETTLQRDIKELDAKGEIAKKELDARIETTRADLKRDIKELDAKIEATRADLKRDIKELDAKVENFRLELDAKLDAKIEITRIELKRDIAEAKAETIKWMVGLAMAQLAMLAGILLTLMRVLPTHP